ncbi:MAG: hypothetical protein ACK5MA_11230, partial [Parachlamydiaceae bacterium]
PHFLVFSEFAKESATPLIKFSDAIGQNKGFQTMASFVPQGTLSLQSKKELRKEMMSHFKTQKVQSFIKIFESDDPADGMKQMMRFSGLGPLSPNTLLLGSLHKETKSKGFEEVIQAAYSMHYNVVIMNDDHNPFQEANPEKRDIHIWWDDQYLDNSNLMLVFSYMLQCNPIRKNSRIFVKAIVADEFQKKIKIEEFEKLSLEKRLPIDIKVYVASNGLVERMQLISEFSKNAEMTFISLAPPPVGESMEDYLNDLKIIAKGVVGLHTAGLVLSSEQAPLHVLLH